MALDFNCILHKILVLLTGFVENSSCKIYNEYEISYAFYIDKLKASNIFILKKGELEDYITDDGQKIIEDLGFANQKELKIIKLSELVNNSNVKIEQVLDVEDYIEVIQKLKFNS